MKMQWGWVVGMALLGLSAMQARAAPAFGPGLPPPGINAPGAKPQAVPLPDTGIPPSVAPAARQQATHGKTPGATVHTDANGDKIEVYRRGGAVYMVRVIPKHGLTQTYFYDSPTGSLVPDPALGPVSPVYYTIYQWDGPRKPASGSSSGH